jgi:hypothetical protein
MTRRWIPVVIAVLAGCGGHPSGSGPAPTSSTTMPPPLALPLLPLPPQIASATIVARTGQGLYVVDPPVPGEASVSGAVQVEVAGAAPPAGTTVALNGVPLVPRGDLPGLPRTFWSVDPTGAQPVVGGDGALTLAVQTGGQNLVFSLPCPPGAGVATSPPAGASLGGSPAVSLSWSAPLPANTANVLPSDFFPVARLRGRDATTGASSVDVLSQVRVPAGALGVSLDVPKGGTGAYLVELSVPGIQTSLGTSAGYCGRLRRIAFAP